MGFPYHYRMKKAIFFLFFLCSVFFTIAQSPSENEISIILNSQIKSWNEGNVNEFMTGYWNHDSLMFVGKNGVTYGYGNVLNNYKKYYPDTVAMGKLSYDIIHIKAFSPEYYFIVGKFYLKRTIGDAQGFFTLIFRKINGKWLIISDHSS